MNNLDTFRFLSLRVLIFLIIVFLTLIGLITYGNSLSLSANVPDKYSEVVAGEKFYFEMDIKYPENLGRVDLRFEYKIFGPDNELVAQAKVLKAVETQASFIDSISIPKSVSNGVYSLEVKVLDYGDLDQDISTSFHVVSLENDKLQLYFIILIAVAVFIALLVLYDLKSSRDIRKKLGE